MTRRNAIVVGERRGKLTLIARITPHGSKRPRYRVRCDCGVEYEIGGNSFRDALGCKNCTHGGQPRKYGAHRTIAKSRLYSIWVGMRQRCRVVDDERNAPWAGRGITVCAEWEASFAAFESWALAHGYRDGLSIDRVEVDGNYEPPNCEWVTKRINSQRARAAYVSVRKRPGAFADYFPLEALFGHC